MFNYTQATFTDFDSHSATVRLNLTSEAINSEASWGG